MRASTLSLFLLSAMLAPARLAAQELLNGSFENNLAPHGFNQMDLTNEAFNDLMMDMHSFGYPSQANLDLITTGEWGGPPHHGNWYIALQAGGADQFSFSLTQPLYPGITYTLTYHDRVRMGHCATPIQIGVSNAENSFGMLVHTGPEAPSIGEWTPRLATFSVPYSVEFITIRALEYPCWVQLDDLCLNAEISCIEFPEFAMPNVFTPNGDGSNDTFGPISRSGITSLQLTIVDRWGNEVFTTGSVGSEWDGTHNGRDCTDGVYYWTMQYTTTFSRSESASGSLMLFRDR